MKAIREEMGFSLRDLAAVTHIPYRTLQNYEGGQRSIPQDVAELLRELLAEELLIKSEVYGFIDADIARWHPHGIRSEVTNADIR